MSKILYSYKVQDLADTVVDIDGDTTYAGDDIATLCSTSGSGCTLYAEPYGNYVGVVLDAGAIAPGTFNNTTSGNYTVSAVAAALGIDSSVQPNNFYPVLLP